MEFPDFYAQRAGGKICTYIPTHANKKLKRN